MLGLVWLPVISGSFKISFGNCDCMDFWPFSCWPELYLKFVIVTIRFMVFVPVIMIPLFSIIYLGHAIGKFYNIDEIKTEEIDAYTVEGQSL